MTKSDLCDEVVKATGATYAKCWAVAIELFGSLPPGQYLNRFNPHSGAIAEFLILEKTISIRGLGTFIPRVRKGRPAWNLRNMEKVTIPDRVGVYFRPATVLKRIKI